MLITIYLVSLILLAIKNKSLIWIADSEESKEETKRNISSLSKSRSNSSRDQNSENCNASEFSFTFNKPIYLMNSATPNDSILDYKADGMLSLRDSEISVDLDKRAGAFIEFGNNVLTEISNAHVLEFKIPK